MVFFFLIHLICNSVLVGILFVTQLITYPSFLAVDSNVFIGFHKRYTMNISVIVIPFMVGELFSLIYLNYIDSDLFLSLMILLVIWLLFFDKRSTTPLPTVPKPAIPMLRDPLKVSFPIELI